MESRLFKKVILERREEIEVSPTIFQYLLPAGVQAAKQKGRNQTQPGGLPELRKTAEYSGRTKQLEFTRQKMGEERAT